MTLCELLLSIFKWTFIFLFGFVLVVVSGTFGFYLLSVKFPNVSEMDCILAARDQGPLLSAARCFVFIAGDVAMKSLVVIARTCVAVAQEYPPLQNFLNIIVGIAYNVTSRI